ncbi:MAG: GIY-YIG nuclease family protein [Maribacter sp.]
MGFVVYILFSKKMGRYYAGQTNNIQKRLATHNNDGKSYTSKGRPWILKKTYPCKNRTEAVRLEAKIKKRGIKRYLDEN